MAATLRLEPEADTWASSDTANANHGADTTLEIGGFGSANDRRAYLRFNGTIPAGAVVTRTTLRVYFDTAPSGNFDLRLANPANSSWDEATMTWNTPPPPPTGPVSGDITSITAGYNNISVPLLRPGTPITYILTRNGAEGAQLQSKEGANTPELVVEYVMPSTTPTSVCSITGCVESRPSVPTHSWGITVADFNGDHRDDYLITRHESNQDQIWLQQADGTFAAGFHLDNGDRHGCTAGDVNGDNRTDIYCMLGADGGEGLGQKKNELWIAQADGVTWVDQATAWGVTDSNGRGRRPLLFDFSHDGKPDLYVTNFAPGPGGASGNTLFINLGDHFEPRTVSATGDNGAGCVDDGDWDRDGFRELLVCGEVLNLFHNNSGVDTESGPRNFLLGEPVPSFPRDASLSDVNGDGWDDIVVITNSALQIRLNLGAGNPNPRFPISFSAQLADGRSVSVGDLTGDGAQDIYVVEGVETGRDGSRNAPDKLFTGPNWAPLAVPQADFGTGDDSEFINTCRKTLIVTNGRDFARGPTQFIDFHPSTVDTQPPTAPANMPANAVSSARVNLSWSASTDNVGVTCYEVFRNGVFLTTTTEPGYSDMTASPATAYSYEVQALDAAGNRSAFSNSATVTTPNTLVPPPPRPAGASPLRASLVLAYTSCLSPNRQHGPPLSSGSCNPPEPVSDQLTIGTVDSNGQPTNSVGSVRLNVVVGDPSTQQNEADVGITASMTDVRRRSNLADYTGQVQLNPSARITDRSGGPSGTEPATTEDVQFPITVPCVATSSSGIGGDCSLSSSFNAIVPGAVVEGKRAMWQLAEVGVYDGGADGQVATAGDNELFATQGIFVP